MPTKLRFSLQIKILTTEDSGKVLTNVNLSQRFGTFTSLPVTPVYANKGQIILKTVTQT